ncbi:MAG: hypothetical protein IT359_16710 [Gemmatimonadaceae bacterium]|nr:hypothetical protein [Gemmatimonadaceae bacterium]
MRFLRLPSSFAALLTVTAFASVACLAPERAGAQSLNATVVLPGFRGVVRMDTVAQGPTAVRGSPAAVFTALRRALDSLGVEASVADSAAGLVGNLGLKVTKRFAGKQMSTWVDCGIGHTGPTANAYRVNMAILAGVAPSTDGGSNVRIAVAAGAQAYSGPLGDPIACESTGAIERRVLELVRAATGGA